MEVTLAGASRFAVHLSLVCPLSQCCYWPRIGKSLFKNSDLSLPLVQWQDTTGTLEVITAVAAAAATTTAAGVLNHQ